MFSGHYNAWRESRINCIKKYIPDEFFNGKTLLELGCGYADNGNEFSKMGAIVTASDARKEHLDIVNVRFPNIKTVILDADKDDIDSYYDIILHWGVLYHLKEIENHLEKVLNKCNILLLETEVIDSIDNNFQITHENGYDQAYNNVGIRPSATYIERILEKHNFNYKMIKDSILNADFHTYDWEVNNTNTWRHGLRRFWICWKDECPLKKEPPIQNPKIAMYFPGRITSYEDCISQILKLKEKYDITFFCSLNLDKLTDYEYEFFKLLEMNDNQYTFEKVIVPDYVNYLDVKGCDVVKDNAYSHFYNNKKCFDLITKYEVLNNCKFDIIIKYRPDICSSIELPINVLCNKNTVYVPIGWDWNNGLNDQIAYGDYETMRIYSTLNDRILKYCNEEGVAYHPETLLLKNMIANGINIVRFEFDYNLNPRRK